MKSDQERLKLVAAYLSGQLTIAERNDLERWINASPENQRLFNEALKIWENSGTRLRLPVDETDRLWLELKARMDKPGRNVVSIFRHAATLKIAASIILVLTVIYFLLPGSRNEPLSSEDTIQDAVTISAGNQVATLYLPDSSRVWLNANSKLTYPREFGKQGIRRASLEGEAFFNVQPDKNSPFTVATGQALITVVGTAFNLRQADAGVILTVSEGEVAFSADDEEIPVKAGEKAVWNKGAKPGKSANDDANFEAWRRTGNPEYEKERLNPAAYLTTKYTWRKNAINQSVIEGTLANKATLAAYTNVVLKATYLRPNRTRHTVRIKVNGTVKPGGLVHFQKRLLDIFTNTRSLEVEIESAAVATSVY